MSMITGPFNTDTTTNNGSSLASAAQSLNLYKAPVPLNNTSAISIPDSETRLSTLNLSSSSLASVTPTVSCGGDIVQSDKRVRISLPPKSILFYNDSSNTLLSILKMTNGVVFPYQPKVDMAYSASYQENRVLQSNFTFYSYESSSVKPFTLSCDFPVRNQIEGQYVIAATTFLRCLTMMFTGNDKYAGAPPSLAMVSGMGFGGLDNIPVAITDVNVSYPDNVDYISITLPGLNNEITKVPTITTISITCTPMFSRAFASKFSLDKFSKGLTRLLGVSPQKTSTDSPTTTGGK